VGKSLSDLSLKDQNDKVHPIDADTKKVVFAFSKDVGHSCNEYFASKGENYLKDNKIKFVADLSSAPSIIRSMFILPGLKDFKHTVLIITDKAVSANYKPETNSDKVVVVELDNKKITAINYLNSIEDLDKK
ncbi:MAG: hypothetical protein ABGW74_06135, partial [Campylobacterales bacterium]